MFDERVETKTIQAKIPTIKCDFCGKSTDNNNPTFGVQRLCATITAITECGCDNKWHICPACIKIRLREIHDFHEGSRDGVTNEN